MIKKIKNSIFLKMYLSVLFTTMLLIFIFFFSLKLIMRPHIETSVKKTFVGYSELLFEDVGDTFDSTLALEKAEKSVRFH